MVKIIDVAQACGVSTATVSRVLANKKHVRPEVREKVLKVAKEMDYRPNRVASSLRSNQSKIIALIISDIENPFFQKVSRAVEDTASKMGYSVMLCNNDEDPDKERNYLNLMRDENVAGIILSPTPESIHQLKGISDLNIPIVIIDRRIKNPAFDNVVIDNVQACHTIVTHLIEHGHQRIAGIFGSDTTTGSERKEGFIKALKDKQIKPRIDLIKSTQPREDAGYKAALTLLDNSPIPDAIFASNSLLAAGALRALRYKNISIPDKMAFASFDETTWSRLIIPALTVIEQPTYEIGFTATELLINRIKDPTRYTREVVLQTKLIIRQSCGCK